MSNQPTTTTHVISVESSSRNDTAYPSPTQYTIDLPQRYRNVWSAQLLNIAIAEFTPRQRIVCLQIDKLNTIDSTAASGGVNFCFAKIPLISTVGNIYYVDAMSTLFPVIPLQNPIATLDKLKISFTDLNGNVLTNGNSNNHSMQIQLQCGDYLSNGGGSTITQNGRILGGSR
jgi:hypothetical protein